VAPERRQPADDGATLADGDRAQLLHRRAERAERSEEAPALRGRFALRAALPAKLLVSYLVVLALVLLPAFLILRRRAQDEVRGALQHELAAQVDLLARRLGEAPPAQMASRMEELLRSVPVRVTVIDPRGSVLADSAAPGSPAALDNHLGRPEVRRALEAGSGAAVRHSATTGETMIYAARRFPDRGPVRGVVRLAVPTSRADRAASDVLSFLDQAGAAAVSLALVLSLIAAIVVSRPLRRIARGARALAAGDLGHVVDVRSRDELGEVATSLEELAAQLRVRLLEAGADRMTLRALLDDLPVGAILYGADLQPRFLNGAARSLLELSPASEMDDARSLIEQAEQAEVVARVLANRTSEERALVVPGRRKSDLRGRWIAVARADGAARPALLLWQDAEKERRALAESVVRWGDALRVVVAEVRDPAAAGALARTLVEMDRSRTAELPSPDQVESIKLADLCDLPVRTARAQAGSEVSLALDLPEPEALVVESGGRVEAALRRLLVDAVAASEPGAALHLRGEQDRTRVRLSLRVRARARAPVKTKWIDRQVSCLGGEAGFTRDGDEVEVWLSLPRA
jgi:HAMP domain-containing protein